MLPLVLLLSHFLAANGAVDEFLPGNLVEPQVYIETTDCGAADKIIAFHSASVLPDPIIYPGKNYLMTSVIY